MPRKETITRDYLVETAFTLAKQEGAENVTARKLAAKAGCSTQPIFRLYDNMEDLLGEVFARSCEFFQFFYDKVSKNHDEPFVDLGLVYIKFATEEPNLFKMLFLSDKRYDKTMYEILNGDKGIVGEHLSQEFQVFLVVGRAEVLHIVENHHTVADVGHLIAFVAHLLHA